MRIAHATDIHWFVPPPLTHLPGKRSLGTTMLYVRGRRHHFDPAVQRSLVAHIAAAEPDVVIITGDLTAQALQAEFALAREALDPLLASFPVFVQPGNHDVYTSGSKRDGRMARTFGEWMHLSPGDPVARLDHGELTVLGLDPNRPHWSASGRVPADQLRRLRELLDSEELDGRSILLALHYPVVNPRGELYDNRYHGLRNADALQAVLTEARNRPLAILHGHKHHGYRSAVDVGDGAVTTLNPGSSGYGFAPDQHRQAHFNVYTVEDGVISVERHAFDGERFAALPEPYAAPPAAPTVGSVGA